jgi:hypothetical protein
VPSFDVTWINTFCVRDSTPTYIPSTDLFFLVLTIIAVECDKPSLDSELTTAIRHAMSLLSIAWQYPRLRCLTGIAEVG